MQLSSISDDELVDIFGEKGMIDKPVHILRFQKTLNEWNTNPQEIVANILLLVKNLSQNWFKPDPLLTQTSTVDQARFKPDSNQTRTWTASGLYLFRPSSVPNLIPYLFQTCPKSLRLKLSEIPDSYQAKTQLKVDQNLTLPCPRLRLPVLSRTVRVEPDKKCFKPV